MGHGYYLGNTFIKRMTRGEGYIKHYTTKVVEVVDGELKIVDGWSLTDYYYVSEMLARSNIKAKVLFRAPKQANSIFVVVTKDEVIMPGMSYDIVFFDEDAKKFYLKPLAGRLGFKSVDDLADSIVVYDQFHGRIAYAKDIKPSYFPCVKSLSYNKPDITIVLHTIRNGKLCESTLDVYDRYYFYVECYEHPLYGRRKDMLFMGYITNIWGIVPPVEPVYVPVDAWRGYYKPRTFIHPDWVKLTDTEWCGLFSESAEALRRLQDILLKLLEMGVFEAVATVYSYSSNVLVLYVDFYVKKNRSPNVYEEKIKSLVRKIQFAEAVEILENIFNF